VGDDVRIWDAIESTDRELAAEIANKAGMPPLPDGCVPGVALNARLLQRHFDNLDGSGR
jgi:hypothetical protein